MGQLVNGRIVNEAAQSGEPSSVRDHGDNAPSFGCSEDGVLLVYFCHVTTVAISDFSGGHGSIVKTGISASLEVRICFNNNNPRTYVVVLNLSQSHI